MIDVKKLPLWLRLTPVRERALQYAVLREYEHWGRIQDVAEKLNISPYLCYQFSQKFYESDLLDIGPEGYQLKPKYTKEVPHE
jgi:hypothetical protein